MASAASLARAPTPPLNMIATGISSSTVQLAWSPPASGSPVDHYVISARTSAENFYRIRMVVSGDLTSATADVVQDLGIPPATAYYVSIAAVDAAGHESLYAYPEYRCDSTNTCSQPADALNVTAIATATPTPANHAPVINAGPHQTVATRSTGLSGSATDDGSPNPPGTLTYVWSKVSGPAIPP